MKIYNVFDNNEEMLEQHSDERGLIADVFYNVNVNHVAIIESKKNAIRGNHYHKETIQSVMIVAGSLEYWYKEKESDLIAKKVIARKGDLVVSDQGEVHAMKILENNTVFLAFTNGKRGGSDYESDTYRVDSIIGE